jgi:hypothetical protein
MTPRFGWAFPAFHQALLRAASLLAPARRRAEWRREWRSELWHVRRACTPAGATSWPAEREVTAFCLGAFQDAICLRKQSFHNETPRAWFHGSPAQCICSLAAALAVGFAAALLLPGVRAQKDQLRYRINPGLILIQDSRFSDETAASISFAEFSAWKARRQRYFDGFAYYRVARETVSTGAEGDSPWSVAHSSSNLFSLLGSPTRFASAVFEDGRNMPALVLSCETFAREFDANPQVVSNIVRVGRINARIAGVAPCGAWRLPGKVDAWLLEPDPGIGSSAIGFAIAHLTPLGQSEMTEERVHIAADNSDDLDEGLWGISIEGHIRGPWDIYLFAAFLAFLSLPAVTSVSMAESSFSSHRPSWPRRLCRGGFLCAKVALLLPIAYYLPLDLAYWHAASNSFVPEYIQLIAVFSICLFGMRWVILDQRRRCPVCLRCVSNPARVGDASRSFLAWNGTEMICLGGHTLLHVPGLPTSWFSTQRWLYLDNSWEFLFAEPSEG